MKPSTERARQRTRKALKAAIVSLTVVALGCAGVLVRAGLVADPSTGLPPFLVRATSVFPVWTPVVLLWLSLGSIVLIGLTFTHERTSETPSEAHEHLPLGYGLFLREGVRSLRSTASLVPSSRFLASAMLDPFDLSRIETLVELGCGTGALIGEILRRLKPTGRLISIDVNRRFIQHLKRNCHGVRLRAAVCGAENLAPVRRLLDGRPVHAVVSSLGLSLMDQHQRLRIFEQIGGLLEREGVLTQYQYLLAQPSLRNFDEEGLLRLYFESITRRSVLLNVPPAVVYVCRQRRHATPSERVPTRETRARKRFMRSCQKLRRQINEQHKTKYVS